MTGPGLQSSGAQSQSLQGNGATRPSGSAEASVPADVRSGGGGWRLIDGARLFEAAIAQTTLLTGLFFYFGWAQASANYGYFGIDVSILRLSFADFLLRSIPVAVRPFFNAALYGVGLTALIYALLQVKRLRLAGAVTRKRVILAVAVISGIATIWSIVLHHLVLPLPVYPPTSPIFPVVTGALLIGCLHLWRTRETRSMSDLDRALERLGAMALVILTVVGLFWHTGIVASQVGTRRAQTTAANLDDRPNVAVFTTSRLSLAGTGVVVDPLLGDDAAYRYRYTGLKLLVNANERYVLAPIGWQRGRDSVYLLKESDDFRLEFQTSNMP